MSGESPNLDSKSWFQRWNFKQENIHTGAGGPGSGAHQHHHGSPSGGGNGNGNGNGAGVGGPNGGSTPGASHDDTKDKEYSFLISDRPLNSVKADLIHAFLSVSLVV